MSFDIASLIRRLRVDFLKTFRKELGPSRAFKAINAGGCGEFSDWLINAMREAAQFDVCPVDGIEVGHLKHGEGEHLWTFFKGRHYDAEVPDGVEDWRDLPFFLRNYKKRPRRRRSVIVERELLDACVVMSAKCFRVLADVKKGKTFDEAHAAEKARALA